MEDGDGDLRWRSSLKPFKAGVRGRLGRRYRAPKGGAQGGRYKGEKVKKKIITHFKTLNYLKNVMRYVKFKKDVTTLILFATAGLHNYES